MVHEAVRAEELAERRLRFTAPITPGLTWESTARRSVLAAQGLGVKYDDAAEVRIVVAEVLAAAADAVLVAHHLKNIVAHLVTARPVEEVAWRQEARGRKGGGGKGVGAETGLFRIAGSSNRFDF